MIGRVHHLDDERLLDVYFAERVSEPVDPPAAEHLVDCDMCAARYTELADLLDAMRASADEETDELFPADCLRAQQQQIARALERVGHPAQVISFPGRRQPHETATPRVATRWIAAAAAAGLLIGVGTGRLFDSERRPSRNPQSVAASRQIRVSPGPVRNGAPAAVSPSSSDVDEAFMSELELAIDRPRTRELVPFDNLTPHVREIAVKVR